MRNYFFLLTVLAVTICTSVGDQMGLGDGPRGQNDFYLEDMHEGSGNLDYSSYSSYYSHSDDEDEDYPVMGGGGPMVEASGEVPVVGVSGSMHLNKVFIEDYNNPNSIKYMELQNNFILAMDELMNNSPLSTNYISTTVLGFSPGSVKVDFEVQMESITRMEESLGKVIESGINQGVIFEGLNPNASSLVIKPQGTPTDMTFTTPPSPDKKTPMMTGGGEIYRPTPDGGDEVDVEEKNILDLILGDPIIIAAIVGGLIVILLSVILLFLFVVYRLKKKDEGSYSLDEPAKAKDPTAYWKETKEFYA